ncbi:MAG: hypothetical protein LKE43_11215 [Olsenella sp.]|jgi:hypothetical protein|nr:hypothetical protein [Olsenella sp.]MCH3956403.1 hypothetical protein [Olsenella sp.]
MRIAFNKLTALHILRTLRSSRRTLTSSRKGLLAPTPEPYARWTARRLGNALATAGVDPADLRGKFQVMVPEQNARIRSKAVQNTIYTQGLPAKPVIEVEDGAQIPCPELLFVELGTIMSPVVQLLVGLELCGRYSRCGADPRNGPVTFGVKPVTTARKIRAFLAQASDVAGLEQSRRVAEWLMDEAWSPQESIVDALARMPLYELGYELGELRLNPCVVADGDAELLVAKRSRVPDTLVVGTAVGSNYDGGPHFGDFDADVTPDSQQNGDAALGSIRAAIVADKRRDRDLLVQGLSVLPVTKEDLMESGGLDRVMLQAMSIIERLGQGDYTRQKQALRRKKLAEERQKLIWSLLPGTRGRVLSRELAEDHMPEMTIHDEEIYF